MTLTRTMAGCIAAAMVLVLPARAASDFFPESSADYIEAGDLSELDCWGLWHARNEIYARNNYRFKTAKAQAEFGTSGWVDNVVLNPVEQANVALIQQYEKAGGCS
jgi:hypothetical protein